MLARSQGLNGNRRVHVRGKTNVYGVDLGVCENGFHISVLLHAREVVLFAGTADIALYRAEVPRQFHGVGAADRRDFDVRNVLTCLEVRAAHEPQAESANLHTPLV